VRKRSLQARAAGKEKKGSLPGLSGADLSPLTGCAVPALRRVPASESATESCSKGKERGRANDDHAA